MCNDHDCMCYDGDKVSELEALLSASQAREAELREKLSGLTEEACVLVSKLAAAEARIEELEAKQTK